MYLCINYAYIKFDQAIGPELQNAKVQKDFTNIFLRKLKLDSYCCKFQIFEFDVFSFNSNS